MTDIKPLITSNYTIYYWTAATPIITQINNVNVQRNIIAFGEIYDDELVLM